MYVWCVVCKREVSGVRVVCKREVSGVYVWCVRER